MLCTFSMEELIYRGARVKKLSIHNALKEIGQEGVVTENGSSNYLINTRFCFSKLNLKCHCYSSRHVNPRIFGTELRQNEALKNPHRVNRGDEWSLLFLWCSYCRSAFTSRVPWSCIKQAKTVTLWWPVWDWEKVFIKKKGACCNTSFPSLVIT